MTRSALWDNYKGILIFLVVITHFLYGYQDNYYINVFVDVVYMFHMPAFAFISGYFSKSEHARGKTSIGRLFFAYVLFNGAFLLLTGIFKPEKLSFTVPYYSYWYILALVVWRLSIEAVCKFRFSLVLSFIVTLLCGFFPQIDNTFSMGRILCFYPFFMLGYRLNRDKTEAFLAKRNYKVLIGACLMGFLALFLAFILCRYVGYTDNLLMMVYYNSVKDLIGRILILSVAVLMTATLLFLMPDRKIPLVCQWGRYSLAVFLLHRPFALLYARFFTGFSVQNVFFAAFFSIVVLCVFGNKYISLWLDRLLELGITNKGMKITICAVVILLGILAFKSEAIEKSFVIKNQPDTEDIEQTNISETKPIYRRMTEEQRNSFDDAFHIVFCGDLILLEDQVRNAWDGERYDFTELFEYTKKYFHDADLAIGVFEGPMAGEKSGYSTGNFDDGKALYLNYPDEFAKDIQKAGIDFVTLANNHLLDKDKEGAVRTLNVLDSIGLEHTGSYTSAADKSENRVKLLERQGIRIALLSYTYGSNYYTEEQLFSEEFSYVTSMLAAPESAYFEQAKSSVEADFEYARQLQPDVIIVLPHMGTQFITEADEYQKVWCDIFRSCGADIILGDHSHSVQPIELQRYNNRMTFTAFSPGNYTNIYREYDGDASVLIDVYIDRQSKQVIGGSVVPMWTRSKLDGNYQPIPVYDIVTNTDLQRTISTYELGRVEAVYGLATEVCLKARLPIYIQNQRLFFDVEGFIREPADGIEITDAMRRGTLYRSLAEAEAVAWVGDSVTKGSENGGYGWYEPIESAFGAHWDNYAWAGATVATLLAHKEEIAASGADLYVIAVGTNDVRYRDATQCAMTAEEYVDGIRDLTDAIQKVNASAQFVLIAPWLSMDGDPYCPLTYAQKVALNEAYSAALEQFCEDNGYGFIDANSTLNQVLTQYPSGDYLIDHIHPNPAGGISLYAQAVMLQ